MKKYKEQFWILAGNPLFVSSLVMIFGSNFGNAFAFLYHFILGRQLGPVLFGELASVINLVSLISSTFAFLALVTTRFVSIAKTKSEIEKSYSWFMKWALIVGFVVGIATFFANNYISSFLHVDARITSLVSLMLFFSVIGVVLKSTLQGLLRFKSLAFVTNFELILKLVFSLVFVSLGQSVFGAMGGILAASISSAFLILFILREYRIDYYINVLKGGRDVVTFAIPAFIFSLTTTSFLSVDVVLAKHFISPHDAGLYASLSTLGKIILYGAAPIAAVMFPMVSKKYATGKSFRNTFYLSFVLTLLGSLFAILVFWLFPNVIIQILYGKEFVEGSEYLVLFAAFAGVFSLSSVITSLFLSLGKTRVVIFPFIFATVQIAGIYLYNDSIATIISISLASAVFLLIALLVYLKSEKQNLSL